MEPITTHRFDPTLTTELKIREVLRNDPTGTARPFYDRQQGQQYLLIHTGEGEISKTRLSNDDLLACLSGAKLSELEGLIAAQIDKYPQLSPFKEFSIVFARHGETYTVAADNPVSMFVATNKLNGQYFDFRVDFSDTTHVNYSTRIAEGARHSGDIGSLLQTVDLTGVSNGTCFVASVIGYARTRLPTYIKQQPSIVIVDSANNRLIIVPLSLDRTTVGADSTFAVLVSIKMVDGDLKYTILPRPITLPNIDTSSPIGRAFETAIALGDETLRQQPVAPPVAPVAAGASAASADAGGGAQAASATTVEVDQPVTLGDADSRCTLFVQSGVVLSCLSPASLNAQVVGWGRGFSSKDEDIPQLSVECEQPILPHVFGEVVGPLSSWCHQPIGANPDPAVPHVIVVADDTMTDQQAASAQYRGDGVLLIIKTVKLIPDGQTPEQVLNTVNINAATSMAGPLSIVLVCIQDQLLWYRGIRFPGLIDEVPMYGTNVTDQFSSDRINEWIANDPAPFPVCVPMDDRSIYFNGRLMPFAECKTELQQWSYGMIIERINDIIDLLTQLSVQLDTAELIPFTRFFTEYLETMVEKALKPDKDIILAVLQTDQQEAAKLLAKLRGKRKKLRATMSDLASSIANLSSQKGLSKKEQSIARQQRKAAIASNVAASQNMSREEMSDLLEKHCDSIVSVCLDPTLLRPVLAAVADNSFMSVVHNETSLISLSPTMPHAATDLITSLLELTAGLQHDLGGAETTLGYPFKYDNLAAGSVFTLPILTKMVTLTDPSTINWTSETNADYFALPRIWARGTIANAIASREYQISASSNQLGYFLIHLILRTMKQVKSCMLSVPTPDDGWDTTNCQAMRGLTGLLLATMASTAKTLSPIYKVVYDKVTLQVVPDDQLWILLNLVEVFPYTGWNPTNVFNNTFELVSRWIYRTHCLKACQQMQLALDKTAVVLRVLTPEWRQFCELLCTLVLRTASDPSYTFTNEMTRRLIERCPSADHLTSGTKIMRDGILTLVRQCEDMLQQMLSGNTTILIRLTKVATFSWIKHSGIAHSLKNDLRERTHAATTVEEYGAIYSSTNPTKWSTTPWTQGELDEAITSIICTEMPPDTADSAAPAQSATLVVPTKTWVDILADKKGSESAVSIAMSLTTGATFDSHPDMKYLVMNHFNTTHDEAEFDEMQRLVIKSQLEHWRDHDSSINAGVSLIAQFCKSDDDDRGGGAVARVKPPAAGGASALT